MPSVAKLANVLPIYPCKRRVMGLGFITTAGKPLAGRLRHHLYRCGGLLDGVGSLTAAQDDKQCQSDACNHQ